jgi:hypothetical protein
MVRATTAHTLSMLQTIFSQREPPRILFRGVSEAPHRSSCHERRLFFCLSVRRRCPRRHVSARINLTAEFLHRKKNYSDHCIGLLVEKRFPAIVYPSKNELLFTDYNFPKFLLEKEQNTPKPSHSLAPGADRDHVLGLAGDADVPAVHNHEMPLSAAGCLTTAGLSQIR